MKNTNLTKEYETIVENIKLSNIDGLFHTYKVPVSRLFFNPFNDRFAKEINAWELDNNKEASYDEESQSFLFQLLSSISANKATEKDILKNGLLRPIVIDSTGVIVDGNRRISILKKLSKSKDDNTRVRFSLVEVIVIPRELSREEIHEYETKLQISEDEKKSYDPINIILKINKHNKQYAHLNKDDRYVKVADLMGSKYSKKIISEKIETFRQMEIYLSEIGKNNRYELLENTEDQFKQISLFSKNFKEGVYKLDFDKNHKNYKRCLKVLYAMISLNLRANPNFRKLVSKANYSSPIFHLEAIQKLEKYLDGNKLNEFMSENPGVKHPVYNPDALSKMLSKLQSEFKKDDDVLSAIVDKALKTSKSLYEKSTHLFSYTLKPAEKEKIMDSIKYLNAVIEKDKK